MIGNTFSFTPLAHYKVKDTSDSKMPSSASIFANLIFSAIFSGIFYSVLPKGLKMIGTWCVSFINCETH